jgi:hypothetical protein
VQVVSAPMFSFVGMARGIPGHRQKRPTLRRRKTLDRIAHGRSRNHRTICPQVAFESLRIDFPRLAQHPSNRLLQQVLLVGVKTSSNLVGGIEREPTPYLRDQCNG